MKENDLQWLSEYFSEDKPAEDSSRITRLFCDEDNKNELRKILQRQFSEILSDKDEPSKNLDHILFRIHYNINTSVQKKEYPRTLFLKWTFRVAAAILLPLLVFWGIKGKIYDSYRISSYAEIHAPAWTRTSFILPDGTSGWLNSKSSIRYNVDFKRNRNVELTGEAFFDVETDPKNTFTVNAGEISVKVHGTRFNIASWENEDNIEVVLEEGKIELSRLHADSSIFLGPNELAVYSRQGKDFSREVVETGKYISWTEGKLVFRNDPPSVIERRLERWYDVDIEVVGSPDQDFRLRATFVDESLEDVLGILKKSMGFDFTIGKQVMDPNNTYEKRKVTIFTPGE